MQRLIRNSLPAHDDLAAAANDKSILVICNSYRYRVFKELNLTWTPERSASCGTS